MHGAPIDVSIIIVNWNTRDLVTQCLQSVYDSIAKLNFEIILVDNASTDDTVETVHCKFPQVRLIENTENVGFARANNEAIRISHGRYVLLLNSDTIVQVNALDALVCFADRHPEAGIVGCRLLNTNGSVQPSWAQFPTVWSEILGQNFRKWRPLADGSAYDVDWVGGACLLARREAIDEIGLLDEGFFMYSEETDWCYRMVKLGWRVYYFPGAEVIHLGGGSSCQASERMATQLYKSKLRFFRKHYGALLEAVLWSGLVVTSLLKSLMWGGLYLLSIRRYTASLYRFRKQLELGKGLLKTWEREHEIPS